MANNASGTFSARVFNLLMWDKTKEKTIMSRDSDSPVLNTNVATSVKLSQLKVSEIYAGATSATTNFYNAASTGVLRLQVHELGATVTGTTTLTGNLAHSTGTATITANGASSFTTSSGTLTLDGAGGLNIGTAANVAVDFNAAAFDLDAAGALTIDSATSISMGTTADVAWDIDTSTLDIDSSGAVTIDSTAGVSIDAAAASNFTTSSGDLTLTASGNVIVEGITFNSVAMTGAAMNLDSTGAMTIDGADSLALSSSDGSVTVEGSTFTGNDLVVPGNLTVSGTTTQVNTTNLQVKDSNILLNDGGGSTSAGGAGLDFEEGGSVTGYMRVAADRAGYEFKVPNGSYVLSVDPTATATMTIAANLGVEAASLIDQDLTSNSTAATFATLTLSASLIPDASGGADIGSTSREWGDVYIADDKQIKFGSDQNFTIEYDENGDDVAQFAGASMRVGHGAATELQFRDSGLKIYSSADAQLDIDSDGEIELTATTIIDMNAASMTFDATAGISVDAASASNFSVAGASLTLATTTSGELDITAAGLLDINAAANMDIDVTGTYDMVASGVFSIDGTGASNVTATSGNLTISTVTTGDMKVTSAGDVDITLGDASGAKKFAVHDSSGSNEVAYIDSDGNAQFDGTVTINGDTIYSTNKEIRWAGYDQAASNAPSNNDLFYVANNSGAVAATKLDVSSSSTVAKARCAGVWRDGDKAVLLGECSAGLLDSTGGCTVGDRLYASPKTAGTLTTTVPSGAGEFVTKVGIARSTTSADGNPTFIFAIEDPIAL